MKVYVDLSLTNIGIYIFEVVSYLNFVLDKQLWKISNDPIDYVPDFQLTE